MQNVEIEIRADGRVAVVFDPAKRLGPSASGKTTIVATSSGNQKIVTPVGEVAIGFNAYVRGGA